MNSEPSEVAEACIPQRSRVLTPRQAVALPIGSAVCVGGRVTVMRNLGSLRFWKLAWGEDEIQLVGDRTLPIRRLDIVEVEGVLTESQGHCELHVSRVLRNSPASDRSRSETLRLLKPASVHMLRVRAAAEQAVRRVLDENKFVPVRSPGIVGNWVAGQTGAFSVDFYGQSAYLSISNMLCHQILIGSGLGKIYEIGPIYRQEHPPSARRLAEFTMVDVGIGFANLEDLLQVFELLVIAICKAVRDVATGSSVPEIANPIPRISYAQVLAAANLSSTTGAQLPSSARKYLAAKFPEFVWVTGFPSHTRPFFVRAEGGTCVDAQLWYGGKIYLAAGGERETSVSTMTERIEAEGKDPARYQFFLDYLRAGLPRSAGMGFGLERFLASLAGGTAADYAAFPRPVGIL